MKLVFLVIAILINFFNHSLINSEEKIDSVNKKIENVTKKESINEGKTEIRKIHIVKIGDTLTLSDDPATEMLPGYKEVRPMVFSGFSGRLVPKGASEANIININADAEVTSEIFHPKDSVNGMISTCGVLTAAEDEIVVRNAITAITHP